MNEEEFHQKVRLDHFNGSVAVTREIGLLALKTIITLNSGAFVVLLTFIGNAAAQTQFSVPLNDLKLAMFCFLIGISFAFASIAYTYVISQNNSPYPSPVRKTDGWFVPIVVTVTGSAFAAFAIGVLIVLIGVEITQ